jgi:hypothetical protein
LRFGICWGEGGGDWRCCGWGRVEEVRLGVDWLGGVGGRIEGEEGERKVLVQEERRLLHKGVGDKM